MFSRNRWRRVAAAAAIGAGLTATVLVPTAATAAPMTAGLRSYLVITAPGSTAGPAAEVAKNDGAVYATYDAVGVIVAHSSSADFAARLRKVSGVQKVGASRTSDVPAAAANPAVPAAATQNPAKDSESVRVDMSQIQADKAWAITTGSPNVTVGVLDTGVDDQHQDLKANFDTTKSASCAYGKLDTRPGSWRDVAGHGTHVAGTIAAAKNGVGAIGVAPGVKVASVRIAEEPSGLFFAENTICAFVHAADKGFQVTNNSYYVDPWLYNCPDNADQDAIQEGVRRAVAHAEGKGVLTVAAAGNSNHDLANKKSDNTSSNDSTAVTRQVTTSCLQVPGELPGVVSVGSITTNNTKSSFSNHGKDKINAVAPGNNVYSTLRGGKFGALSGTSMASPHVAGVAALLKSVKPSATTADLRAILAKTADDLPCGSASGCTGTPANNSYYGEGRVDAAEGLK